MHLKSSRSWCRESGFSVYERGVGSCGVTKKRRLFFRFFTENRGWTLPALFSILRDLRDLAFDVNAYHFPFPLCYSKNVGLFRRIIMRNITVKIVNVWRRLRGLLQRLLAIV